MFYKEYVVATKLILDLSCALGVTTEEYMSYIIYRVCTVTVF